MSFNLAISNIAWEKYDDPEVLSLLRRHGFSGIEIAPGRIWGDVVNATPGKCAEYSRKMSAAGFKTPALQGILFGHPELQVFDRTTHSAFAEHIKRIAGIAEGVGADIVVFGAPGNRRRRGLAWYEAREYAADFFRMVSPIMCSHGCVLGLEANPADYSCDFLTNTADLADFVSFVNEPGIAMHFDCGASVMNCENTADMITGYPGFVHCHISEPMLGPLGAEASNFTAVFSALRRIGYGKWCSIEMKKTYSELLSVESALAWVRKCTQQEMI